MDVLPLLDGAPQSVFPPRSVRGESPLCKVAEHMKFRVTCVSAALAVTSALAWAEPMLASRVCSVQVQLTHSSSPWISATLLVLLLEALVLSEPYTPLHP